MTSTSSHTHSSKKGGQPPHQQFLFNFSAAAFSSCAHTTAFYPVHRVKNILQTQDAMPEVSSGRMARFTIFNSFGRIIKEQGMPSLWRGNLPYMLRHVPSTSLSFSLKDALVDVLPKVDKATHPMQHLMWNLAAGGLAGSVALAVVYPLDFTSIRMAANLHDKSPGMMEELRRSCRRGGFASWYRGFGVSVLAIGGYKALYFGLYDTAKAYMQPAAAVQPLIQPAVQKQQYSTLYSELHSTVKTYVQPPPAVQQHSPAAERLLSAPVGGGGNFLSRWLVASCVVSVASTVTFPLDVMRKRLVVDTLLPLGRRQYPGGLWDCVRKTAATEGLKGFYRSYAVDMTLRLGGGVLLVIYDEAKRLSL